MNTGKTNGINTGDDGQSLIQNTGEEIPDIYVPMSQNWCSLGYDTEDSSSTEYLPIEPNKKNV